MQINKANKRLGYVSAFASGIILGTYFMVAKEISEDSSPIFIAFMMAVITAIISSMFLYRKKSLSILKNRKAITPVLLLSLFGFPLASVTFFLGLSLTDVPHAIVISTIETAFTVLLAIVIFADKLKTIRQKLGVCLVIFAVFMATLAQNGAIDFFLTPANLGTLLIILGSFFFAVYNNLCRVAANVITSDMELVRLNSVFGALLLLPLLFIFEPGFTVNLKLNHLPHFIYIAAAGMLIPLLMYFYSLRTIGTVRTVIMQEASIPASLLITGIMMQETLDLYLLLLCSLFIIIGVYLLYKSP